MESVSNEIEAYDFELPRELIAQDPLRRRSDSRMMIIDRKTGAIEHSHVRDLPTILIPGDTLVLNDSKVIPARIIGMRTNTRGRWEGLFLREDDHKVGEFLCKTRGKMEIGETVTVRDREGRDRIRLNLLAYGEEGKAYFRIEGDWSWPELLEACGMVPLPPYIRDGMMTDEDRDRYQTVYARNPGSVAAPTAGLHFTTDLLHQVRAAGMSLASVTLHVGIGTFRPVQVDNLADHKMHEEVGEITEPVVKRLHATRSEGGRIVAVGTTTVRVLESASAATGQLQPWKGSTDIFLRPGHTFRAVDALITNFHLPRSSLLVLVSAFAGYDLMREAYRVAIAEQYRFYSYGDCMLIQ